MNLFIKYKYIVINIKITIPFWFLLLDQPQTMIKVKDIEIPSQLVPLGRTKVSRQWTDTDVHQLITEVRRYQCIYDERCPKGRKRINRVLAWQKVANTFHARKFPLEQCHAKWICLRACYSNQLKNFRKTGKKPNWEFFDRMSSFVDCVDRSERFRLQRLAVCICRTILKI